MAEKDKTNVRRIKATDHAPKKSATPKSSTKSASTSATKKATTKKAPSKNATKTTKKPAVKKATKRRNPLRALGDYFKGAWYELKQVRWPTRSATWSMTAAVLLFTLILATLILLLDVGFNWLFEQILR